MEASERSRSSTQGGRFGGWCPVHRKMASRSYTYNFLGLERFTVAASKPLPPGPATVVFDFDYDEGEMGNGGSGTLSVNGKTVANGRIGRTQPMMFSADETADVGLDNQTPVVEGIGIGRDATRFTGTIREVVVKVGGE